MNFEDIYNQAIKTSQNLVEDVRFSRSITTEVIKNCSEQICLYLDTNTNILSLLNTVQDKYPYMFSHPVNVAFISCAIGKWMNIDRTELINLVCTGLLHDIGKAKIRDSILNKPGTLLAAEMEIMKTHPAIGYKLLESLGSLETDILLGVLSHHERQDGSGYPNGLKGKQISIFARIVAVADVFSAITSTKAYKMKTSFFKAVEEIQENSFGYLDPQICQIFMNHILNYYCGSQVRLSNELVGVIVYINPTEKTKPVVRCENSFFNLTKERHLEIVDILS